MKYDDAEYSFLNFETELANEAGGTHTGMYLAWAALRGLLGESFEDGGALRELARLREREITGSALYFSQCDGKLTEDDLSEDGNAFTAWYYERQFVADYEREFRKDMPDTGHATDDFCSVPDTWANFDRIAPMLDERFREWQASPGAPPSTSGGASKAPVGTGQSLPHPGGERVPASPPLALVVDSADVIRALRERTAAGDRDAWFELGVAYVTGEHIARDFNEAANAFTQGASLGSPEAQFNLAVCFQHGDGRPQDHRQAMHWFAQAASSGHAEATFHLALGYRAGNGLPQDVVASNALMLLAQSRGVAEARRAGVMAGSMGESVVLLEQLRQPGKLLPVLAARRRPALQGASQQRPATVIRASAAKPASGFKLHAGHGALLIGAAAFIILLAVIPLVVGTPLKFLSVALAIVGAYGVFRCSGDLGHGLAAKWLLTLLALIPVFGSFACILVLLWTLRRAQASD